jgi:hypothetical protein
MSLQKEEHFANRFMTAQEYFIAYCRCREAVKLFRFLLPPYSLIRTALLAVRQRRGTEVA